MYYQIHWECTLTGVKGIQDYKYDNYAFCLIMANLYNDYYGKLFEHYILRVP
jgi:hypothetical protein